MVIYIHYVHPREVDQWKAGTQTSVNGFHVGFIIVLPIILFRIRQSIQCPKSAVPYRIRPLNNSSKHTQGFILAIRLNARLEMIWALSVGVLMDSIAPMLGSHLNTSIKGRAGTAVCRLKRPVLIIKLLSDHIYLMHGVLSYEKGQ